MLKLVQLIFAPNQTWAKVAEARRWLVTVFVLSPLPLALLGSLGEGYGMMRYGQQTGAIDRIKPVTQEVAVRFEQLQLGLDLGVLILGAILLYWLVQGFHVRADFRAAFTVMAYSMGPFFVARAADGVPMLSTWFCWSVGAVLALHLLYHGVAMVLQPDQTKGFGLFLTGSLALLLLSGLAHFIALQVLRAKWLK